MNRKLSVWLIPVLLAVIPSCTGRQISAPTAVNSGDAAEYSGYETIEVNNADRVPQNENCIPMTNVTRSVERRDVRTGDEFMGFTLTDFARRLQAPGGGGRWAREAMSAELSGELTVSGTLHGSSDENFWYPGWGNIFLYGFGVNESDFDSIPFPENDFRISFRGFDFTNSTDEILELLGSGGLSRETIDEIISGEIRSISISDVTIVLDEFSVSTNAGYNEARIAEIKSMGETYLTRINNVGFVYVTRRNEQEQNMERLAKGDEFNGFTVVNAGSLFTATNHVFGEYREAFVSFTGEKIFTADIVLGRDIPIQQGHLFGDDPHLVVHKTDHELFPMFPGTDTGISTEEVFVKVDNPDEFYRLLEIQNITDTGNLSVKINSLEMSLYDGYSANVVEVF